MSSYKPSAPPIPNPSSSSSPPYSSYPNPSNPYNYNHNNHNHNNYNTTTNNPSSNYPPPPAAQAYHVGHQSYSSSPSQYSPYQQPAQYTNRFPPGTDPEIIRSFEAVDRDRSGFVEDYELQNALSSGFHRFNLRTVRLLMFLFRNPSQSSLKIGPGEFTALWRCLGEWRAVFGQFDRDRSGRIDADELRDALYSLGYAVPPPVLQLLISHYDDRSGRKVQLDFDCFVECGTVIKGLTEKFKEKDSRYTGSATISYDDFMTMVLPFLVTYT